MLRLAVFILLLANAGYFAWSQGVLANLGWAPQQHSEPERLQQQLRPEALQLLQPAAEPAPTAPQPEPAQATAAAAPAADTAGPAQCLQAGIYDEDQSDALRRALALQLPDGSWNITPTTTPGRWMVYMGKFADSQALEKKRAELRVRKLDHDRAGGALEPGLSLGRFSSEEAATRELTQLVRQGVRSARVVQERPDKHGFVLRLPAATPALRQQVEALPMLGDKRLRSCNTS
ncbi:SPOR domain-containing protein [Acidovorax sp. Be4]|uniref:SPOR domain-containing protein n=1 Tax=Acidovorax bellezanensis TaxID=2976702 RepID=A0ABT2PMC4_9BURK|nr:SPOR domain-containing protein [Acidovorax sp. Be4]MCT9811603.1 SPOR domain-containing protein [Acidovorax sp. Be4]